MDKSIIKKRILFSILLTLFLLGACTTDDKAVLPQEAFMKATVTKVVDGDTLHVTLEQGASEKIRLIGVNTPEYTSRTEYYGKEASQFTQATLMGKKVYLERDVSERDKFGRLLRYVWLELPEEVNEMEVMQKQVNAILVKEGYAQVATYPPDVRYQQIYLDLQTQARKEKRGLWGKM